MTTQRINQYEAMFLFPQSAVSNLQGAVDHVREILARADAEVLSLFKWDERRLAFEIAGNKRGLYLLAYFKAPAAKLADIERACNLSEQLLRAMITRADHLTQEQMELKEREQALHDEIRLRRESPQPVIEQIGGEEEPAEPQLAGEEL
jgi:small subunit ribosomal protein S6